MAGAREVDIDFNWIRSERMQKMLCINSSGSESMSYRDKRINYTHICRYIFSRSFGVDIAKHKTRN
jgi:hypothetical protein